MSLDHRPHLLRKLKVARPEQVPEERIHGDEIHVVMVLRQVAVTMQRVLVAREIGGFLGHRKLVRNRICILLAEETFEMLPRSFMPAQSVAGINTAPAQ